MEFLKKNFRSLLLILAGCLNFIFYAIPYMVFDTGWFGTVKYSGYQMMGMWDGGFAGVMCSLLQIFVLIVGILFIVIGTLMLVKSLTGANIPEPASLSYEVMGALATIIYAGLNLLLLIFDIILAAQNNIGIGAGVIIILILSLGYAFLYVYIGKKFSSSTNVIYACSKCGKQVSAGTKFCPVCGGDVTMTVKKEYDYVCSKCGKQVSANTKFCPVCGGEVVGELRKDMVYVCSKCGKPAKKTDKFCSDCGGDIVCEEKKVIKFACSKCGKEAKKTDKFCPACGGEIKPVSYSASQDGAPVENGDGTTSNE